MRLGIGAMREKRAVGDLQRFAEGVSEHEIVDALLLREVRRYVRAREQQAHAIEVLHTKRWNGSDVDLSVEPLGVEQGLCSSPNHRARCRARLTLNELAELGGRRQIRTRTGATQEHELHGPALDIGWSDVGAP